MERFTRKRRLWMIPVFIGIFAIVILIAMLLWNNLMPAIFHLPLISYWQAAGLLILTRLLFGFHGPWGHHHRHNFFRDKWEKMSPEQREKFKEHLRGHHHFWNECQEQRMADKNSESNK